MRKSLPLPHQAGREWPGSPGLPGVVLLHLLTHLAALTSARVSWVRRESRAFWKAVCSCVSACEDGDRRSMGTKRHSTEGVWRQRRRFWQKKGKDHSPNTQLPLVSTKFSRSFPALDFSNLTHSSFLFST